MSARRRARAGGVAIGGVLAAMLAPRGGEAQSTEIIGVLDAGAATVAYDEFARSTIATVAPSVRIEYGRTAFVARSAYSRFASGNTSLEGSVAVSAFSPALWHLRGELYSTASSTRYSRLHEAASNVLAVGRVHVATAQYGGWAGGGLGAVAQGSRYPDEVMQLDVGGWLSEGHVTITGQVLPTSIGDSIAYTDALLAAKWAPDRAELSTTLGLRRGERFTPTSRWAELAAAYWFTPHVALVAGGGMFPSELWRGLPGGRYASAALRVATRPPRDRDPKRLAELTLPYELGRIRRPRALAQRFSIAVEADGTRTLRVLVPGARKVELMGDFTDWTPASLTQLSSGAWAFNLLVAPGVHRINLRIDGGAWVAPPGLTIVRDEFGGEVGLLVVP